MQKKDYMEYLNIIESKLQEISGAFKVNRRVTEEGTYCFATDIYIKELNNIKQLELIVNESLDITFCCTLENSVLDYFEAMELSNELNRDLRFGKIYLNTASGNQWKAEYEVLLLDNLDKHIFEKTITQIASVILRVFSRMAQEIQEHIKRMEQNHKERGIVQIEVKDVIIDPFRKRIKSGSR